MKYLTLPTIATITLSSQITMADLDRYDESKISVKITSHISVQTQKASIYLGNIMQGEFDGELTFLVQANNDVISLSVGATDLYKSMDVNSKVAPLKLSHQGAFIFANGAAPIDGEDNNATWIGNDNISGFPAMFSESISFESRHHGYFDNEIDVQVRWNMDDPGQPTGEYGGYVTLWAALDGAKDMASIEIYADK